MSEGYKGFKDKTRKFPHASRVTSSTDRLNLVAAGEWLVVPNPRLIHLSYRSRSIVSPFCTSSRTPPSPSVPTPLDPVPLLTLLMAKREHDLVDELFVVTEFCPGVFGLRFIKFQTPGRGTLEHQ